MTARDFRPSRHGFPFPNWFPPGTPVIEIPTPFGTIPIGDAHGGVCGGMVFAAVDLFEAGRTVPREPTQPVFKFFCRRLLDSWHLPFGALKYYDWQRRPTASKIWGGVRLVDGLRSLTLAEEWPRIQARLDLGRLAPLGLVKAEGLDPRLLGRHHQVLAYDYSISGVTVVIHIYDPNYPGDDTATLTFTMAPEDSGDRIIHSCEGPVVRGMFSVEFVPAEIAI
jgi:hypothetical protein